MRKTDEIVRDFIAVLDHMLQKNTSLAESLDYVSDLLFRDVKSDQEELIKSRPFKGVEKGIVHTMDERWKSICKKIGRFLHEKQKPASMNPDAYLLWAQGMDQTKIQFYFLNLEPTPVS